ncbi:unnamed protein product [Rotaria sordida]|uniref:Choline transporter-like protein n=1 Tax=Rotaria sordida TaxID=392033 RepID=A0A819W3I0_9BILA|nr:unnamed protein product [Rotaria sordida]
MWNVNTSEWDNIYIRIVVLFFLLLSWLWGALTFGNIAHFITVCAVGQWWFPGKYSQQYSVRNSIKRAFTTSFGALCYGSLFKALIKPTRSPTAEDNRRQNIFSCVFGCIFRPIKRAISYFNEWTFIYSTLTGQGYPQASRSFTELFQKRGWTVTINDNLIETSFLISNIGIGIASALISGILMHILIDRLLKAFETFVLFYFISFLIGLLIGVIITRILLSSVRTVFICFALNPEALAVTHPDYLQKLSKAWHKFYPKEFANSGYANKFVEPMV